MNTCRFFGACKTTAAGYFLMTFVYTSKARSTTHLWKEQILYGRRTATGYRTEIQF